VEVEIRAIHVLLDLLIVEVPSLDLVFAAREQQIEEMAPDEATASQHDQLRDHIQPPGSGFN
jgi:hypothetical protein